MSAIEWIGASQVTRSETGSSSGFVSVGHVGVLEPGVGERLDQLRVELGVGDDVDRGAFVEALEVERVDGAGLDQRGDQLVVPVVDRVELEAQGRVDVEPAQQRLDRGAPLAAEAGQPHRVDEVQRPRLAAEHRGEVGARPGAAPGRAPPTRRPSAGSRASPRAPAPRPGTGRSRRAARENSPKVSRAGRGPRAARRPAGRRGRSAS